jgi:hypothetical protein
MTVTSWMGSHFTLDDLVKESSLTSDYFIRTSFTGTQDGVYFTEVCHLVHAKGDHAAPAGAVAGQSKIRVWSGIFIFLTSSFQYRGTEKGGRSCIVHFSFCLSRQFSRNMSMQDLTLKFCVREK